MLLFWILRPIPGICPWTPLGDFHTPDPLLSSPSTFGPWLHPCCVKTTESIEMSFGETDSHGDLALDDQIRMNAEADAIIKATMWPFAKLLQT